MTLWREDGVTQNKTMALLCPQAVWMFELFVALSVSGYKSSLLADNNWCRCHCAWHSHPIFCLLLLCLPVAFPLRCCFLLFLLRLKTVSLLALQFSFSLGLPKLHKSLNWLLQDYEKWASLSNGSFSTIAISACYFVFNILKKRARCSWLGAMGYKNPCHRYLTANP